MWWLAVVGLLGAIAFLILRSFQRDTKRTVSAEEVTRIEHRWHAALYSARAISRQIERTQANQGLAEIPA